MDWILAHLETVLAVVAFLFAGWKAWKAGTLNTFLVRKVEALAEPADKAAIKAEAVKSGVDALLGKVVANAGLSSSTPPANVAKKLLQAVLPLMLGAVLLAGCANQAALDALRRVGDVVPRAADDIHPTDAGGAARKAELLKLAEECRRLGEAK